MTVSYENTTEDAVAWTMAYFTRTRPGRAARKRMQVLMPILFAFLLPLYIILFGSIVNGVVPPGLLLLGAVVGALAGYLTQTLGFPRRTRQATNRLLKGGHFEQYLGPKETSIQPGGLRVIWPDGETFLKWSGIKRVDETETHILFFLSETNFLTIPKRAFASDMDQRTFLALMERYRTGGALAAGGPMTTLPTSTTTIGGTAPATHTPGAPWWRNRAATESDTQRINNRPS